MLLGQCPGAGVDLLGHRLVEDFLTEPDDLVHAAAGDERQCLLPGVADVVQVFGAEQPESELAESESDQVTAVEVVAGGQSAGEMEDRSADHHRVVDVEEGGGG